MCVRLLPSEHGDAGNEFSEVAGSVGGGVGRGGGGVGLAGRGGDVVETRRVILWVQAIRIGFDVQRCRKSCDCENAA